MVHPCQVLQDGDMITVNPNVIPTLKRSEQPGSMLEFAPLNFMSPWMFTPVYLEVCYATCSTVFLRSPLAQPKVMEIPSPYPPTWHQLVFEWYASIKRSQTKKPIDPVLMVGGREIKLKPKFDSLMRFDLKQKQLELKRSKREKMLAILAKEKAEYKAQGHL